MTALEISLAVLLVLVLVALAFQYRAFVHYRAELQELAEERENLKRKRPAISKMAEHPEDDETRQLIRDRYDLFGKILAAGVASDSERINDALDEIDALVADRNEFMRQTRLIYERLQPQMTDLLREKGLTDKQIEVCCLYALGLNGKSIQQYTRDGRHFQHVGHIRKQLGLGEHDRNIDGYIRSLLK